jgi:histidine ammonia-lyase
MVKSMPSSFYLGETLSLSELTTLVSDLNQQNWPQCRWSSSQQKKIFYSVKVVQKLAKSHKAAYGINTGFGSLSDVRIPTEALELLQTNILKSHAAGVGDPLPNEVSALAVLLRLHCLSQGYSGIRLEVLKLLSRLLEAGAIPVVPCQGSVGACGDLAPLAHIGLCVIGEGKVTYKNKTLPTQAVLDQLDIKPIKLAPKEGLSLVNGTQVSTAILLTAYVKAQQLCQASAVIQALSIDAFEGSISPFKPKVAALRQHPGVADVSAYILKLLEGSEILQSHSDCTRVQDPYSFRCGPQVLGMAWEALEFVGRIIEREVNSVTDNPVIVQDEVVSNGNFHGQSIAFAADTLKIALAEVGNISERRLNKLLDHRANPGVPQLLAGKPGVESGLMMVQVTAASLVSENKTYAMPQSIDSIPTNLDKEDHVSMATTAARFCSLLTDNLAKILACECLGAYRSLQFRRPLKTSPVLETLVTELAEIIPSSSNDFIPSEVLMQTTEWLTHSKALTKVSALLTSKYEHSNLAETGSYPKFQKT